MSTRTSVADIANELGITPQRVIELLDGIGVHEASASTPLGKATLRELTDLVKPWGRIVAHVTEPASDAPPFVIEKRDEAIVVSKEWEPQSKKVVWTKIHQPTTAGGSADDLSFLCEWENALLTRATQVGVKRCVRLLESSFSASPMMHMGDTPVDKRQRRMSRLRTYDAGPTLDVWRLMKPRVDGYAQPHPFVEQRNYLQLVRGILIALEDFHDKGFIHCDLHPGNIALPVRSTKPEVSPERGEHLLVEPVWDEIRIIDLDFSASQAMVPPIRLPHQLTELGTPVSPMSDHLRLRLLAIDTWLKSLGQLDRCYDREFWAKAHHNDRLRCFTTLDWREDLYQLGFWLAYIRDSWGGAAHVLTMGDQSEVNRFLNTFAQDLMAWGGSKQIVWDPVTLTNSVKAPDDLPHAAYIARIDRLLRQLNDLPKSMLLLRRDHDPQYEASLAKQRLAEEENSRQEMQGKKEAKRQKQEEATKAAGAEKAVRKSKEEAEEREDVSLWQEARRKDSEEAYYDYLKKSQRLAYKQLALERVVALREKAKQEVDEHARKETWETEENKRREDARKTEAALTAEKARKAAQEAQSQQEQARRATNVAKPQDRARDEHRKKFSGEWVVTIVVVVGLVLLVVWGTKNGPRGVSAPEGQSPAMSTTSASIAAAAKSSPPPNALSTGTVFRDCADCPEMVVIPPGSFTMGSPNVAGVSLPYGPPHSVSVKPFALAKTEVTQGQWRAVMGSNPSHFTTCGDTCPVDQVSWNDAQGFIQKLNARTGKQYRLPSEAEWEYACRAGGRHEYCGSDNVDSVAWHVDNSGRTTHPVGQKRANAWGLYDMSGNVWEWVEDCWHENYQGAPTDGSAWKSGCRSPVRVLRGGSWANIPRRSSAPDRTLDLAQGRVSYDGFRPARMLP